MKELMTHVERIVRPVRAFAGRKLRMRRELLAHLQSAVEEERAAGGEESAAVERAKRRLGDSLELTQSLQSAVPWIERLLLYRFSLPPAIDRLEQRGGRWWKLDSTMTMLHAMLTIAAATMLPWFAMLAMVSLLHLDRDASLRYLFEYPAYGLMLNAGSMVLTIASIPFCRRFIITLATAESVRWKTILWYAVGVFLLPLMAMVLLVAGTNAHPPTADELLGCAGVGLLLVAAMALAGRLIGTLRRPYAEWLTLEIAG